MEHILPVFVLLFGTLPLVFLLRGRVPGQDDFARAISASLLAVGLWICFFYLISIFRIPVESAVLLAMAVLAVLAFRTGIVLSRVPLLICWLCALCCLPYLIGYVLSGMLPGCDTAMHGYITRLVIEQHGLPTTYRPLLPVDDFGAYSAGFHLIAACASCFQPQWLMEGMSAATVLSYLVAILGLAFLFMLFAPSRTALIAAMVVFWFDRSLQIVVDWGGTPTVLSLGLVFGALAFFGYAIRERSFPFVIMGSTTWSAAALTHLIPAYSGIYLCSGLVAYWCWRYRPGFSFLLRSTGLSAATALVWLTPLVARMSSSRPSALSKLIWDWQHRMMDNVVTGHLPGDAYRLLGELKFSLSDLTVIAVSVCVGWLLYRRKFRELAFVAGLSIILFMLVLNTGYWFLPLSELIYPERVMYFFVVPCGILMCYAAQDLGELHWVAKARVVPMLATAALAIGCYNCFNRYVTALGNPNRQYDDTMKAGFAWIGAHTAPDAVIHVSYDTEGMWVPALSYRAAVGTHLHFVHVVADVARNMMELPVDHYVLRLHRDTTAVGPMDPYSEMNEVVLKNAGMELVQTRERRP